MMFRYLFLATMKAIDRIDLREIQEDPHVSKNRTSLTSQSNESSASGRFSQDSGSTKQAQQLISVKGQDFKIAPVPYTGTLYNHVRVKN